jgi:hypothetical protein
VSKQINWKELAALTVLMVAVVILWNTWFVYPLKVLVVFFHELSHGLMAIATGGSIQEIQVVAQEGGTCVTAGGNRFLILSAGYLGSLIWGGAILVLATRTKRDKLIAALMGGILIFASALYVRPFQSFGFAFGLLSGAALIGSGVYLGTGANDGILKVIGLTSSLYAVLDIKSDILDRPGPGSDAYFLAQHTHIPTLVWGILWIVIAISGALYFLVLASRGDRQAA